MAILTIKAGDFKNMVVDYHQKYFYFGGRGLSNVWFGSKKGAINISEVNGIEVKNQGEEFKAGSAIGAGMLGAAVLGPIGALAGVLSGRKEKVLFGLYFKDGRKVLLEAKGSAFRQIVTDLEEVNF